RPRRAVRPCARRAPRPGSSPGPRWSRGNRLRPGGRTYGALAVRPYRPRNVPAGRRGTPDGTRPVSCESGGHGGRFMGPTAATASPYCGRRSRCARTAPDRGVLRRWLIARRQGGEVPGVAQADEEGAQPGVTDRGDGTRFHGDPLEEVEMKSECFRDEGLDDVPVRAHEVDGVGAVLTLHARVPLPHRLGGAGLHG